MNKTHELLLNIKNCILRDVAVLRQMSADDIVSCIYVEFEGVKQLYNDGQIREITLLLNNLSARLSEIIENEDQQSAVDLLEKIIDLHNAFPDSDIALDFIEEANFNRAYLRHQKENTIIVLGDSHVNYFSGNEELSFKPIGRFIDTCDQVNKLPFTCLHLGACLAYTTDMEESSTGFKKKLDYLIKEFINDGAFIISCFGEIDLRVHVFKEAKRQNRRYQDIVDDILEHYERYLSYLQKQGYKLACWGPIASQKDGVQALTEFPVCGSEIERNIATEYFNKELENWCAEHDVLFMTMFYDMITEEHRTKEEFLSADSVHLGQYSADIFTRSRFYDKVTQQN